MITLLADAIDREYLTAYFEADRLLRDGELDASTEPLVQEVRALSADVLGLSIDAATGEMTGTAADLPLARGYGSDGHDRGEAAGTHGAAGTGNLR